MNVCLSLFALILLVFGTSCTSDQGGDSNLKGMPSLDPGASPSPDSNLSLHIETKSDGSGNPVTSVELSIGDTLAVYGIQRDDSGGFVGSLEDVSWVLNGSVGNLNIQSGGAEAHFEATQAGSATIKASYSGKSQEIAIEVAEARAASLALSPGDSPGMNISNGVSPGAAVSFTVSNEGEVSSEALQAPVLGGANSSNFEIVEGLDHCVGSSLDAGESCTFSVRPVASVDGFYSATLSISDGSVVSSSASLAGSATGFSVPELSLSPNSVENMNIAGGNSPSAAVTFTLENSGGAISGTIQMAQLSGSGADSFQLVPGADNCSGTTLTAGASCTFQVQAMASSNLSYAATLAVNDGNVVSNVSSLSGEAEGFATGDTLVFITSTSHKGDLGGLAGADSICQERAAAGNLATGFKALLSTSEVDAKDRYSIAGVVRLTSGTKVADDASDFWNGNIDSRINKDESNNSRSGDAWSGSTSTGLKTTRTCSDWTTRSGSASGQHGENDETDSEWFSKGSEECDESARLYCIGPQSTALGLVAETGDSDGEINLSLQLPTNVAGFSEIVIRRSSGSVAPASHCSAESDSALPSQVGPFDPSHTFNLSDVGASGQEYSYRACFYDNVGSLVVSVKVEGVVAGSP